MIKKEVKKDFDLSELSYKELIDLYYEIEEFLKYLEEQKNKLNKGENADE